MGSSGGGSSSGAVSYPAYMETAHASWLTSITTFLSAAQAANPYSAATDYDPDTDLAANATSLLAFSNIVSAFDPDGDWVDVWAVAQAKLEADVFSDALINAKVSAYSAAVMARLTNDVLPVLQRGLQNVRAVMTSSYTIGTALVTADVTRDVNKFEADLKRDNEQKKLELISHAADKMLEMFIAQLEYFKFVTHYTIETNRIKIVAKVEEVAKNLLFDEKSAMWNLEAYTPCANMLASASGGTTQTGKGISTASSVLGGALSGAAAGAMIGGQVGAVGGPLGAGIGALVGGLAGFL